MSNFSEKCKLLIQENKLKNTSILNNILKCDSSEHYELILRLVDNDLTHKDIKNKLLDIFSRIFLFFFVASFFFADYNYRCINLCKLKIWKY